MKKTVLILMLGLLFIASNLFAAGGDFIIEGNVGIGTNAPSNKLELHNGNIMLKDAITSGIGTVSPYKFILDSNAQVTPSLEFCGISGCGNVSYDSDNGRFVLHGGGLRLDVGQQIIWNASAKNNITVPTIGNAVFYFNYSINLETKSDNTGKVIIPYGNVGIGTTMPAEKIEVAGAIKIADSSSSSCTQANEGTIKYVRPTFYGCNGTAWVQLNN